MATKVGINGFGRIGRNVFKLLLENPEFDCEVINDLTDPKTLAHLLKYDSTNGVFKGTVTSTEDSIVVNGNTIRIYKEKDPANIPWGKHGVKSVTRKPIELTPEETSMFPT